MAGDLHRDIKSGFASSWCLLYIGTLIGLTFSGLSFQDNYFSHKIIQQTQVVLTKLLEMATI